jgi:hypothetical protein
MKEAATPDYNELKNEIYKALENRNNLDSFIMDTGLKADYLKNYPIFKKYIIDEINKLDSQLGGSANLWQITSKILFDMIYNGLVSLNDATLSEFIDTVGNQMQRLINDPKFSLEPGDIPYDIKSQRLTPQPRRVTDATRPQSVPQLPTANANISLSKNEPQNINLVSRTGAAPIPENITNAINFSLIVPEKNKKYIDDPYIFLIEFLYSIYVSLFNLGINTLVTIFENIPLNYIIKKPRPTAEIVGNKFPALIVGGGITTASVTAYNFIKNILKKKAQVTYVLEFIKGYTETKKRMDSLIGVVKTNTIYFDLLADEILKDIKDRKKLEKLFGKDIIREKIIESLMKSVIGVKSQTVLSDDLVSNVLLNAIATIDELILEAQEKAKL